MSEEKFGKAPFKDEDIKELHKMRLKFFEEKSCSPSQMMGYLYCEFVGSLALCGYSEEFVRKTLDKMFEDFLKHSYRQINPNEKKNDLDQC